MISERFFGYVAKSIFPLSLLLASANVFADSVELSDESGQPSETVTVTFTYTGDGSQNALQAEAEIADTSVFSAIDASNMCSGASATVVSCQRSGSTLQFAVANGSGTPLQSFTGTIDFTIAGGAATGQIIDLTWSSGDPSFTPENWTDGSVEIVDVTAVLDVQPASITYPDTESGSSSAPESFTIQNDGTDGIDMEVTGVSLATGTHFSISSDSCPGLPFTLSDGESCTYNAVFEPQTIADNLSDTVTVTSDAGQTTNSEVALSGDGTAGPAGSLALTDPASPYDFGQLLTGEESDTQVFQFTNDGQSGSSVDVDTVNLTGDTAEFSVASDGCTGSTLAQNESCNVAVEFAPINDGMWSVTLEVSGQDGNGDTQSASATINGEGVSEPRFVSNLNVNLGVIAPGSSTSTSVTISNEGNEDLTISNCSGLSGDTDEISLGSSPESLSPIAPGASDSFDASCSVSEPGQYSASLSCDTNDPNNSTVTYNFSCTGRPLVIPTMQPWGLVLLTLLMLAVGGFSIRFFRA